MKNSYNIQKEQLTPALVLEMIRDDQRQSSQYDPEVDADIELTFESTIEDWRYACDLVSWKPLSKSLNEWFDIEYSEKEWENILEPSDKRTLLELCTFIANKANRYQIKSHKILGVDCDTAGTFLAVRAALKDAGVPTNELKPSTELKPFLIKYSGKIMTAIGKLEPNVLPLIKIELKLIQKIGIPILLIGTMLSLNNVYFDNEMVSTIAISLIFSGIILIVLASRLRPKDIKLGELKTFADLCALIDNSRQK